jgi:hypothetical protein
MTSKFSPRQSLEFAATNFFLLLDQERMLQHKNVITLIMKIMKQINFLFLQLPPLDF